MLLAQNLVLDKGSVACATVGLAARDDDSVTLFGQSRALGYGGGVVEEHVGRREGFAHNGDDRPREGKLAPSALIGGHADDGGGTAEARDHSGRCAAEGAGDDELCAKVNGQVAGGVRDGIHSVFDFEVGVAEALLVVNVLLRLLRDTRHSAHRLHGIGAHSRFSRQHDSAGAVVDGVCHVGDLRAGGAGLGDHGF